MNTSKRNHSVTSVSQCAVLVIAMGLTATASAATIYDVDSCSANSPSYGNINESDVTLSGASATDCYGAYDGNNSGTTLSLNGMDWNEIARVNIDDGLTSNGLELNNGSSSGTWKYQGDMSTWESFFVVTKASHSPGWAAYYFDADVTNQQSIDGTWLVPWTNNNGTPRDLSHLSLYARNAQSVPEPGTLGLIGLGLLALGLRSKRS